jgi:hypothetical protein
MIDIPEKKNKILEFLKTNGPSLPVQIARAIQMDPVFASAILSELLGSKQVKTSHMKIGASPLYLIPGQEKKLEEKTEHLKSIEKETQESLKSKIIITDEDEEPATRIALRNIKDFATPFKFQDKITWKYTFAPQEEIDKILFPKKEEVKKELPSLKNPHNKNDPIEKKDLLHKNNPDSKEPSNENNLEKKENLTHDDTPVPKAWEAKKEEIKQAKEESKKIVSQNSDIGNTQNVGNIFEKEEKENNSQKTINKSSATGQTFLEQIEQFLKTKNTHITTIEEVDKKKVTAIVESNESQSMLFAFNKIRITETELLKCYKIADKKNLPYQIITKGNLTRKLLDTIRAYQKLLKVDNLQE